MIEMFRFEMVITCYGFYKKSVLISSVKLLTCR